MHVTPEPRKAFTLIEVVVAMSVLGILSLGAYTSFATVYRGEGEHRARQVAEAYEARVRAIAIDMSGDPQHNHLTDAASPTGPLEAAASGFTSGASFSGIDDVNADSGGVDDDGLVTMDWVGRVTVCIDFYPQDDPNPVDPAADASVPADVTIGPCH